MPSNWRHGRVAREQRWLWLVQELVPLPAVGGRRCCRPTSNGSCEQLPTYSVNPKASFWGIKSCIFLKIQGYKVQGKPSQSSGATRSCGCRKQFRAHSGAKRVQELSVGFTARACAWAHRSVRTTCFAGSTLLWAPRRRNGPGGLGRGRTLALLGPTGHGKPQQPQPGPPGGRAGSRGLPALRGAASCRPRRAGRRAQAAHLHSAGGSRREQLALAADLPPSAPARPQSSASP